MASIRVKLINTKSAVQTVLWRMIFISAPKARTNSNCAHSKKHLYLEISPTFLHISMSWDASLCYARTDIEMMTFEFEERERVVMKIYTSHSRHWSHVTKFIKGPSELPECCYPALLQERCVSKNWSLIRDYLCEFQISSIEAIGFNFASPTMMKHGIQCSTLLFI